MKTIYFTILMLCATITFGAVHKYYISISEINYNTSNRKLEVAVKVFFDDLQEAIEIEQNERIDDPIGDYSDAIYEYVNHHFSINHNGQKVTLHLIGVDTEYDAVWLFMESDPVDIKGTWKISNSLFVNLFPQQSNLVNFYPDKDNTNKVKGLALSRSKMSGVIEFFK